MTTNFTRDAVTESLARIVAQKGTDYVYPSTGLTCSYSERDGSPSCGVGYVVADLAPDVFKEIVAAEQEHGATHNAFDLVGGGWREGYDQYEDVYDIDIPALNLEDETLAYALQAFQEAQDKGLTWGRGMYYYGLVLGGEDFYVVRRAIERGDDDNS